MIKKAYKVFARIGRNLYSFRAGIDLESSGLNVCPSFFRYSLNEVNQAKIGGFFVFNDLTSAQVFRDDHARLRKNATLEIREVFVGYPVKAPCRESDWHNINRKSHLIELWRDTENDNRYRYCSTGDAYCYAYCYAQLVVGKKIS